MARETCSSAGERGTVGVAEGEERWRRSGTDKPGSRRGRTKAVETPEILIKIFLL